MEANTKLQTILSVDLFNFLKKYLHDFYPRKETKAATQTQKASKATFKQLIRIMASAHPKFLTNFIFKNNPTLILIQLSHSQYSKYIKKANSQIYYYLIH